MNIEDFLRLGEKYYPKQHRTDVMSFGTSVFNNTYPKYKDRCEKYGITDCEFFTLLLLEGFHSQIIQEPFFDPNKKNEFVCELWKCLDSLLKKTPSTKKSILYRQEEFYHINLIKRLHESSKPLICHHYLTCSTDDYDNTHNIKFIITPQNFKLTKAHDIYLIRNYGEDEGVPYPEYQVEYERESSFLIDRIIERDGLFDVYCHEIVNLQ